jgi:DNA-binding PadR family transcriptional regulator
MEDIEQFAELRLGPGTLYGAITNLEQAGLIEPLETEGRRRPYQITGSGLQSLRSMLDSMDDLVAKGKARLRLIQQIRFI